MINKKILRYLFILFMEYCGSIWYPILKTHEVLIENVLHCLSKLLPGISSLSSADCLCAIFQYTKYEISLD